ncbi:putative WD-40 repeat protein [Streptomyces sp. NBRC 110611]|uniref:nSTAND1 domain-containing NTPase n=1 Tax=Streptomyces sp. NBRC 110611 TaxID=1621259 RepID=UPI00082C8F89|nr:hypothetical protein [Streptomyces sp. NBRC 110611]GAU70706.1 putative WD-40 repeat protein [Streptomyces sp. NBRC 110611]
MGRREKPVDPAAGPVQRFAFELRKLRQEAGGPSYRVMAERAQYGVTALSQAAAGEKLPSLPVVLAYVTACEGDPASWERRWHEAAREEAGRRSPGPDEEGPAPYQGLARFEPADHERFFGRKRLVDEVSDILREHRCVALVGPSGSGKSSLLRAGLIPLLQRAQDPVLRPAALRVLTPGEHPIRTHRDVLAPAPADGDTWLVVDQFEEVFTLCRDAGERAEFIDLLLTAHAPNSRLRVVLGIRADFYGSCLEHPGLVPVLRRASVPIGPMTPEELREAVVKPAAAHGLIVERALTARLVEEVADEPGGLPLLSHALLETWRLRQGRTLTMGAYEAAGGLHGAIAQTAENLYTALSPDQRAVARRILLRLITPGQGAPDTRCPVDRSALSDLGSPADDADETGTVLDRLARARLITLDEDTADLAHEALITAWPRLRGWLDEDRERLLLHGRLRQDARTWEELGKDPGSLYRGVRLAEAEETFGPGAAPDELTAAEAEFLTAGRTARTRERRRRRGLAASLAVLVVLSLIAGVVAWQQNRTGDQRRAEATSRRIASIAENMRATDPATAMRLSAAAWRISHTDEAKAALLGAVTQREQDYFTLPGAGTDAETRLSADGRTLVMTGAGRVQRWDVAGHRRTGGFRVTGGEHMLDLSPDGRLLLLAAGDQLVIRDVASGKPAGPRFGASSAGARYAPSGRMVLLEGEDSVRLWDVRRGRVVFQREGGNIGEPVVSRDDRRMALCRGQSLEIWDIAARRQVRPPRPAALSRAACGTDDDRGGGTVWELDPQGRRLAVTGEGVSIWDLSSGKEEPILDDATAPHSVRFSRDGRFISTADDQGITLWRLPADSAGATDHSELIYAHRLAGEHASDLRLDLDRGVIRYEEGSRAGTGNVRTLFVDDATASRWRREPTEETAFSPDGRLVVTARLDGERMRFEARATDGGGRAAALPPVGCATADRPLRKSESCWAHLAFSGDGRTLAYGVGVRETDAPDPDRTRMRPERIGVWNLRENRKRAELLLTTDGEWGKSIDSIALSPDGSSLFALRQGPGAVLEKWDVQHRTKVARQVETAPDGSAVWALPPEGAMVVRPDGRRLATTYGMGFTLPSAHRTTDSTGQTEARALAYSPDGERLALGTSSGRVAVYDGDARRRVGSLSGTYSEAAQEKEPVTALAYSHDGTTLAVGGKDGTIRLWDAASGHPLGSTLTTTTDPVQAITFSPDDRTLLVAGAYIPLRTYAIDPTRATHTVCKRARGGLSRADWEAYIPDMPYRDIC